MDNKAFVNSLDDFMADFDGERISKSMRLADMIKLVDILSTWAGHMKTPGDDAPDSRELKPDAPAYAERNPFESGHTRPPAILKVLDDAEAELARAKKKFPLWPVDMFHALTVIAEEGGELPKAVLQYHYEELKGVQISDIREEAIQTIAMLVRFVVALDNNHYHTVLEQKKD